MARKYLLDKTWAGHAFLAPASALTDATNNRRRYYTTSSRKFIDTSLGGHWVMNPFPQFTGTADLKHKPIFASSYGVGRWWSEVLDDNQQVVHIRCGVPQFNEMTNFFGNFYNVYAGSMARSGRAPSLWFDVGKVAGTIGTLPFQPFILAGQVIKFFAGMPRSKYYYMKPTMYPFWRAYSSYVNGMFVNLGLSPRFVTNQQKKFFDPLTVPDTVDIDQMKRIFPDLMLTGGDGIDFFAVATKPQRLANRYHQSLNATLDTLTNDPAKRAEDFERLMVEGIEDGIRNLKDPGGSIAEYEEAYLKFGGLYDPAKSTQADMDSVEQSFIDKFFEQAKAEARMGAEFVSYRVNFTPTNSDSFNNSATQSSIQSEINAMSSKARMARFNLADGNLSGVIGKVVNAASDIVKGVLSAAQVEGFIAVAGNAFADIQRVYESSSADLNRTTFTIHLRSWAADDWVRLQNLFIPLGGWLAMGLPRATGRSSYDGPFLLEVINQGHTLIREGMIESISIERGVGDVGWAQGGKVLGIDINVTIVDLSTILSVPINPGISDTAGVFTSVIEGLGSLGGAGSEATTFANALTQSTYGEDNKWTDYLATMAGLPLDTLINGTRRWQLAMARTRAEYKQWRSPFKIASGLMSTAPGEFIKAISNPTDRS